MLLSERTPEARKAYLDGYKAALELVERIAREDRRPGLAKDCGYVPGWQRGRWGIADAVAHHLSILKIGELT